MHEPTARLLTELYEAFSRKDGAAMAAAYADDARFSDPVFQDLRGRDIGDMWTMLTSRATDLALTFQVLDATPTGGRVHWEARYTFSTGRKVHNVIEAELEVRDGKITKHQDHFSLWRWSRMALGPLGTLLGWSPLVSGKVRSTAMASLRKYQTHRG